MAKEIWLDRHQKAAYGLIAIFVVAGILYFTLIHLQLIAYVDGDCQSWLSSIKEKALWIAGAKGSVGAILHIDEINYRIHDYNDNIEGFQSKCSLMSGQLPTTP